MKNTHKLYTDVIAKSGSKNEPLEVTENGTYEAPKGTGYSPVNVAVPQTAESGTLKAVLDATKTASDLFHGYKGTSVDGLISYNDTAEVTMMKNMFNSCTYLTSIPKLNTSNVTNMYQMFYNCTNLTSVPQLDTSKVTNMSYMFNNCSSLTTIPLLDTSNVVDMESMFNNCSNLTTIPELNAQKLAYNSSLRRVFSGCTKLKSIGVYGFTRSIDISQTALDHDAIVAFLNQAGIAYDSSQKITLGSAKLSLLSDEEKAIATNKGWTLA